MKIKKISANATTRRRRKILLFIFLAVMTFLSENVSAQQNNQLVRLARLQIDSVQLENYKVALREEIETSLRVEPGALTLYAVSEKRNPTHITILEIYADSNAYKSHIQTPHFIKYKTATKEMVKSLELVETVPIVPGVKVKG